MIKKWCLFTNGHAYHDTTGEIAIGKNCIFIVAENSEEFYARIEFFERNNNCEFIKFGAA